MQFAGGLDEVIAESVDFDADEVFEDESHEDAGEAPAHIPTPKPAAAASAPKEPDDDGFEDESAEDAGTPPDDDDVVGPIAGAPEKKKKLTTVERMNQHHAIARINGKTVVLNFEPDGKTDYSSMADLNLFYANKQVPKGDGSEPVSSWWSRQKERLTFRRGVVFSPGKEVTDAYNLWRGFSVKPNVTGSCKLLLDHIFENICDRDEEAYRYFIGWMAHMIQKPGEKPGVAIVLQRKKGVGKNIVAVFLGQLFENNYITVSQTDQLTGKFNAHMEQALLLHVEEGMWAGDPKSEGPLKSLITSTKMAIERKGIDVIQLPSVMRVYITSNEKWVVPATGDERRFAVYKVADYHRQDRPYFRAMLDQMADGGLGALMHFLQNYDISGFDVGVARRRRAFPIRSSSPFGTPSVGSTTCSAPAN